MTAWQALVEQARWDFKTFDMLRTQPRDEVPESQALLFLQMSTEKLAKACFIRLGVEQNSMFSHGVFRRLPQHLKRQNIARSLGWADFERFKRFLRRTEPIIAEIDALSPAVHSGAAIASAQHSPNVEYPWPVRAADAATEWVVPAEHDFQLLRKLLQSGDGASLVQLIRLLLGRFEAVFSAFE